MDTWSLSAGDPLSLTLAADARLTNTNYTDDQVWELSLGGGEPAALALQTTYGLRAHWMRLFPRFLRGEAIRTGPAAFNSPPEIVRFAPNYLMTRFAPFEGLEVQAEYWAAESQIVTGRITLTNQSILPQVFQLEWVAQLNPIDRQGGMAAVQVGPNHVLQGETAYLYPVVFLTGGPRPGSGSYPALALDLDLYPGSSRQFTWACASLRTYEESLEAARTATARAWDAEQARIELTNLSHALKIESGNPEWDAVLALSQNTAFELLLNNSSNLPSPSFVLTRRPDQGFSVRGDGSDHPHLWAGQTALDAYYLANLLPGAPGLTAGLLRNFLAVQEPNGTIDWKPGLGGQRSRRLAQPLLAALALRLAPHFSLTHWYAEVFPPLLRFFDAWFLPEYDRDGDGFPEWEHPLQTGIEDSPIFDRWSPDAQGINIRLLECPALAAMLLRECDSLIEMANVLVEAEKAEMAYARLSGSGDGSSTPAVTPGSQAANALPALCDRAAVLRMHLESAWDAKARRYTYRDYQTHLSLPGALLMEFTGSGKASSRKRFSQPRRLVIRLQVKEERTYAVQVKIHGYTTDGEADEVFDTRSFTWVGRQARVTTANTYLALRRVEVLGLGDDDQLRVLSADYTQEDCSLFLPLWAGAPSDKQAASLVIDTLLPRYLQPFGISLCPPDQRLQDSLPGLHSATDSALLPWNLMIGEGLLRYGYREQAAELFGRLMQGITLALKEQQCFRQYYHAETGQSAGERGHLHGLAPVSLLLQIIGLRSITPHEIILDGFNPFPHPIRVQYHKVDILCLPDKTHVRFPGGQSVTIDRPGQYRIHID